MNVRQILKGLTATLLLGCGPSFVVAQSHPDSAAPKAEKAEKSEPRSGAPQAAEPKSGSHKAAEPNKGGDKKDSSAKADEKGEGKSRHSSEAAEPRGGLKGEKQAKDKDAVPHDKAPKAAEKAPRADDKSSTHDKERAEKPEQSDKGGKQAGEATRPPSKDAASEAAGRSPSGQRADDKAAGGVPPGDQKGDKKSGERVQVSGEQRTNVGRIVAGEKNINRVTKVDVQIRAGSRVPRSIRLEPLPSAIVEIVPAYRSYRYFVVNDEVCIVDPGDYEIVDVVALSGEAVAAAPHGDKHGGMAALVLTPEEQAIIRRAVEFRSGPRADVFEVGASAPSGIELRSFPDAVVEKVPKVKQMKFFTSESRLAIVDPGSDKVRLVIDGGRG